ncbi:mycothiol conjugate amidase Mca [Gulosibacter molinativorax]|uniref:Mycothiol conjugate amidase Mca n=1 Tax=Gulosibacter molinativorax TaxID=256821 RepID=A0ABT7C6N4_9MICO|nr:mycothiol conjugate amidase Mca [Gulosibacter molinativorax]MDJ1370807.1 mycothiol conjugate amidase Mca [Gulosibacter molinativorax]QUY62143.1 Mycothiol S-conjugate amidase [Gulosibacter molinativorax]
MSFRLLAVHAHPDDESSKGAGTYAAYEDRGDEVMVVSCTGGEAGDVLNTAIPSRAHAERDLPGLRRVEMAEAQRVLGIEHRWLGYRDSGMAREDGSLPAGSFAAIPVEVSVRPLVQLIREFQPHVLVTYDETGGYPHPDHIRTHEVSMLAWEQAGSDLYPELGAPWTPQKLYFDRTMNDERAKSMLDHLKDHPELEHLKDRMEMALTRMMQQHRKRTTKIEISKYLNQRDDALRAHASQVAPDNEFFFGYPRDLELVAYPYDAYELVESRVPTQLPETDLFAGVKLEGIN